MRRSVVSRHFAIAFALLDATAAGALPAWERIGPEGGSICALAAAPSKPAVVYAGGADAGVFRSTDRGSSWSFAGLDLGPNPVCSLAVAGRNPLRVWALAGGKLFRSSDGGRRWLPLEAPVQDVLSAVVAHPTSSSRVFVIGDHGVRRSSDGGVTWSEPLAGLPTAYVTDLVIDPLRPDHMFVASSQGIFRSLDGGGGWAPIHLGLPDSFGYAVALALDVRDGRTLFAASASGALYRSRDAGTTWKKAALPKDVAVIALALGGRSLYVASFSGLWVSRDGGRSFSAAATRLPGQRVADVTSLPYGVLASTTLGVYRSPDAGATFAPSQRGLRARSWWQLEIDPSHPERWYALDANEGLLRSGNGGPTWRRTARELLGQDLFSPPRFLALDSGSSRLYTSFATSSAGGVLARSDEDGRTWTAVAGFGCLLPSWVLADAPRDRLFVGGYYLIAACGLQPGACAVYRSLDDGATFACARDLLPASGSLLAVHGATGDLLASGVDGLLRSSDWGEHWTIVSGQRPIALQISTADPDLFYALFESAPGHLELAHSEVQGATWSTPLPPPPGPLYPDPFDAGRLYALAPQQLFVSENHGETWELAGASANDVALNALAFDPRAPGILYAASSGGGLLRLRLEP